MASTPNQTVRDIVVPGSGTIQVWAKPNSVPIRDFNIFLFSKGPLAGQVNWDVRYGAIWSNGNPFDEDATLSGGVSQATGNVVTAAADVVFTEAGVLPANTRIPVPTVFGPSYSILLTNTVVTDASMVVFFLSKDLGDI